MRELISFFLRGSSVSSTHRSSSSFCGTISHRLMERRRATCGPGALQPSPPSVHRFSSCVAHQFSLLGSISLLYLLSIFSQTPTVFGLIIDFLSLIPHVFFKYLVSPLFYRTFSSLLVFLPFNFHLSMQGLPCLIGRKKIR